MTLRIQNLMLAMLLALTTLFFGFGSVSQNPTSGGYQLFERAAPSISADIQLASLGNFAPSPETASEYANAPNTALPNVPGRVQSRVNLSTGDKSSGWTHVLDRHFNPDKNASQFTVSQSELRTTLQSHEVVNTPVTRTLESADHGTLYVREVDLGRPIGTDKFNSFQPTSIMTVMTDRFGNLVTATPGVVR